MPAWLAPIITMCWVITPLTHRYGSFTWPILPAI